MGDVTVKGHLVLFTHLNNSSIYINMHVHSITQMYISTMLFEIYSLIKPGITSTIALVLLDYNMVSAVGS
jgi:hypothetical protein